MKPTKRLPGIATATKRLFDGTKRKYWYVWRGGPLLKDDDGKPLQPNDPQFFVAYIKAHEVRRKPTQGTLFSLIAAFKHSSEFASLAPKTRKDYQRYLKLIEAKFGDTPLSYVEKSKARGKFKLWRDELAGSPRNADYAWTVLARVLSVAKDRGLISINVCERGGRLYSADRAEIIWTADHIKAFCAVASEPLRFALILALWTGQRQGDLIKLTWQQYDGQSIRLRQGKRKARVAIPTSGLLKSELDARKCKEGAILTNLRGLAWTADGFRTSWGKAAQKAGLVKLNFNDLRGTAVTRLALAGCSVPEIASFTGHSLRDVERILQAHYLGGKFELAEQAADKLATKFAN